MGFRQVISQLYKPGLYHLCIVRHRVISHAQPLHTNGNIRESVDVPVDCVIQIV